MLIEKLEPVDRLTKYVGEKTECWGVDWAIFCRCEDRSFADVSVRLFSCAGPNESAEQFCLI